ncbi:MAG TPA: N-acetyl-gamma-glutamyl-phosphate reductase [Mycobacteriales bacterium]|jgi:N-acetyl-gamma-glutamyl-phosphate reductase|nr:N-acetyl-gamma-glutamyl-phosphate reductase [Mycobacteriales bacterium]
MGIRTAVVGASGYSGGELLRLLDGHPSLEVGALVAGGNAGRRLGELHPHLVTLADRVLLDATAPELAECELVFLALPHGATPQVVAKLAPDAFVVDIGADYRLGDPADWQRWYGGDHPGTWPYGLPELPGARAAIVGAQQVANPGCYATAVQLALAPLLAAELVEPSDIVVVAGSGTSGAGRTASAELLATEVMGDLSPYKVGGTHRHIGEIRQSLRALTSGDVTLSFTPMLVPMPRGILATCTAKLTSSADTAALRAAFSCYDDEPFVTLLPEGRLPHTAATLGSNSAQLQVVADSDPGRAVVLVALDNLGKGAAGQAIQNANLMLGLPETSGLPINGIAP